MRDRSAPPIFQSTLPCGSDVKVSKGETNTVLISIHAPLRERLVIRRTFQLTLLFQSTLPCGSDAKAANRQAGIAISIHAPLRERLLMFLNLVIIWNFNPRSLAGATASYMAQVIYKHNFNPRSLAGATTCIGQLSLSSVFQSTLPCGSDC